MIPEIREKFKREFTREKYGRFLESLNNVFPGAIQFRIAETPVFVPSELTQKILAAGEDILKVIRRPDFKELTAGAIPPHQAIPHENDHSDILAIDFAICTDENGDPEPRLIELQGFPTLLAFQSLLADKYREFFSIPEGLDNYFSGLDRASYLALLKKLLLNGYPPEQVILLEVKPEEQKTRIDFYCTESTTGIRTVGISDLILEGSKLYYLRDSIRTPVKRIYNRVIFDDLQQQRESLGSIVDLTTDLDVEWVPHPNWFYRISKYLLPFIHSPYSPKAYFLDKMEIVPQDLENYVLKPLYSFAGQGVILDVTRKHLESVKNPSGWILQEKVKYADIIPTPGIPAKCEIRMIYFQQDAATPPRLVNNLVRLSKGKMIGVRYNADHNWVGGSIGFFEPAP